MADVFVEAGAGGRGHRLDWTLDFDDVANTVTVDATHTQTVRDQDGNFLPQLADPQQAQITFRLNTGQAMSLDLLTGRLSNGQAFDGAATRIVNSGPRTRTNVRLSVSADRAKLITFSTEYLPPA